MSEKYSYKDVDEYIAQYPQNIQEILQNIRQTIIENAPAVSEKISFGMPSYNLNGQIAYFAVQTKHIGFYPTPEAIVAFEKEMEAFKHFKGTMQIPLDGPVPYELIAKMVLFKVQQNQMKKKK